MRFRQAVICVAVALFGASANSDEAIVALAVEPEVAAPVATTLESAARANDFAAFDTLYRAEPDPAFRALHELWTYSMTERTGAFYGAEMYERLSREHPGYAEFIAEHRIVDGKGEVFYPASETRAFLLSERGLPAGRTAGILPAVTPKPAQKPAGSRRSGRLEAGAPKPQPQPTPAEDLALLSEPVVITPAPAITETKVPATPAPPRATNRGLLLVIIGLIGVGLLALIVRAPREVIP